MDSRWFGLAAALHAVTEGKSLSAYMNKLNADLQTAVMGSWVVWVPAHIVNFSLVPPSQVCTCQAE